MEETRLRYPQGITLEAKQEGCGDAKTASLLKIFHLYLSAPLPHKLLTTRTGINAEGETTLGAGIPRVPDLN